MHYLITLILTIIIESFTLYVIGYRNKELFKNIVIVNILTNPALNVLVNFTIDYFNEFRLYYILFLEILVVVIEWLFLKSVLKNYKLPYFKISFIINAVSFLSGLWINKLFYGVFL